MYCFGDVVVVGLIALNAEFRGNGYVFADVSVRKCNVSQAKPQLVISGYAGYIKRSVIIDCSIAVILLIFRNEGCGQRCLFNGEVPSCARELIIVLCCRYGQRIVAGIRRAGGIGKLGDSGVCTVLALLLPDVCICCAVNGAASDFYGRAVKHNGVCVIDLFAVGHFVAVGFGKQLSGNAGIADELEPAVVVGL